MFFYALYCFSMTCYLLAPAMLLMLPLAGVEYWNIAMHTDIDGSQICCHVCSLLGAVSVISFTGQYNKGRYFYAELRNFCQQMDLVLLLCFILATMFHEFCFPGLSCNLIVCTGVGCYPERKLGSDLYAYWRECMLKDPLIYYCLNFISSKLILS